MRSSAVQLRSLLRNRLADLMAPVPQQERKTPRFDSARAVQVAMLEVVRRLNRPGWSAYLVGGTLRDLLVHPEGVRRFEPRDVDIVVSGVTGDELQALLREHLTLERLTRFGGLHLSKTLLSGTRVSFDVWTLADTWGFHSQQIVPQIENFPGTTFLNIDSCAVELQEPQGRERAIYEKDFFAGMANRTLDVNYAPNPYPYLCAARALLLAARLDFTMTRLLVEFILDHSAAGGVEPLIEAQRSHYGTVLSDASELAAWLQQMRRQSARGEHGFRLEVPRARRLNLGGGKASAWSRSHSLASS